MSNVLDRNGRSANTTAAAQGVLSTAASKVSVTFNGVTTSASGAATATQGVANASTAATGAITATGTAAASTGSKLQQLDAHMVAYRANLRQMKIDAMQAAAGGQQLDAHMVAYRDHMAKASQQTLLVGQSMKFSARDGLNFSRQMSDIGVTAAMGMNPFMIALQQGPQLFDIIQEKAIATGTTVGAVFRAAGATIWAALLPIMPLILAIVGAVALVAAGFGLATREISKGNEDISKGLGLTEKQLERVKKAGVDTGVTIGDTFTAFFEIIGERLVSAFDGPLKWLKEAWNDAMDFIVVYGTMAIKGVIGGFVGGFYAIKAVWSLLPAAIGDLSYAAANKAISAVDWLINKSIDGLNKLISYANMAAQKVGLDGIGTIGNVSLGQTKNPYAGAAEDAGNAIAAGFDKGKKASDGAVDRFFSDVGKRARKNRGKLILEAAGDPEKGPREKKPRKPPKGPKSDAAKFEDIVTGAQNDIATQVARGEAIKLSAEAAATLEQKTKLLNEAQSKGITLTASMKSKIDELAGAYGKAKVAADNAIALHDILKAADADIASLKSQAELIGLVGRQLAYQTEMQKLLNDAKAKGLTVDAAMRAQFEGKASEYADQSQANANATFMDGVTKGAAERMTVLKQEQAQIGLSADEVNRLRIENELLAQARQRNIDLTPADIAAIGEIAKEQAEVEAGIRKTREALDFAKDTARGFFKDITDGLRNGKSLWESFAQAAVNALNKIIDRLIDKAITLAIDAIFTALGGGGGFAKGGIFGDGGVTAFAKGGTFTNSIVDRPTMFASGGALGVMGEAGPEAIMPLKRGGDGALGVQMHGAKAGTVIHAPVMIHNDNRVSGAVSSADIVALQRKSAEQTKQQIARDIPAIIRQFQTDGAII
jgi:hypothetical protein